MTTANTSSNLPAAHTSLTPITPQEFFTRAVTGFRAQGYKRSVLGDDDAMCRYRGPDGLKCLVGLTLPDELYHSTMDAGGGLTFYGLTKPGNGHQCVAAFYSEVPGSLGCELQTIHDNARATTEPHTYEYKFEQLAAEYGLEYPPLA